MRRLLRNCAQAMDWLFGKCAQVMNWLFESVPKL